MKLIKLLLFNLSCLTAVFLYCGLLFSKTIYFAKLPTIPNEDFKHTSCFHAARYYGKAALGIHYLLRSI